LKSADVERGEQEMRRTVAIIDSMTPRERAEPSVINGSRRKRIAKGSGSSVEDVNRLLKQFAQARKLMKGLGSGSAAMKRLAARMPQFR
jgi:signal recognition particle subunit SRP54